MVAEKPAPSEVQQPQKQEDKLRAAEQLLQSEVRSRLKALGYLSARRDLASARGNGVAGRVTNGVINGVAGRVLSQSYLPASAPAGMADDDEFNTESYSTIQESDFLAAAQNPLSTFSIDVDTASYSIVRRHIMDGKLPPASAVRIEEMINYFPYAYPPPAGNDPFSVSVEVAGCPWNPSHRLVSIGLHGREIGQGSQDSRPGANLVFLLDVSGSMDDPRKLPLVKSALSLMIRQLDGRDDVAIVVYAGASGLVLPSTPGNRQSEILTALDRLQAGGGTNGGEGLRLAYATARQHMIRGGINRVILATDGDFNLGITDPGELLKFVQEQARAGVSLTALGFGIGNYKDSTLESLADHGDGNYAYVDSLTEARKALVEQLGGTLTTIAKDVKIQVEFNPLTVGAYRLVGYENRMLRKEDFNDDQKDAGEIGAGHTVTALYEIAPPGEAGIAASVDPLKYQQNPVLAPASGAGELLTLKLRYKEPDGDASKLISSTVTDQNRSFTDSSQDFRFAAAVAAFGLTLRDSPHKGGATFDMARALGTEGLGDDAGGYRAEFLRLVDRAAVLKLKMQ